MKELQEGTKITAANELGGIEHAVILEKADSDQARNVYLVRWLGDGTSTLFEVKEENLIRKKGKKNAKKKRNNSKKSKRPNR
tara:strand:- start:369 stop:614 length:246 start_codon:yes stop_codon:yes gene_type:complete